MVFREKREGIEKQKTEMLMGFVVGRCGKGFEGCLGEREKLLVVYIYVNIIWKCSKSSTYGVFFLF